MWCAHAVSSSAIHTSFWASCQGAGLIARVYDDGHHDHSHPGEMPARHQHVHRLEAAVHVHPHVPDLHHRHDHADA